MCAFRGGCGGDSGGGLVIQNARKGWDMISYSHSALSSNMYFRFYELIGIQSYNMGCYTTHGGKVKRERFLIKFNASWSGDRLPNVMTYVPPLTEWIKANTDSGIFCKGLEGPKGLFESMRGFHFLFE